MCMLDALVACDDEGDGEEDFGLPCGKRSSSCREAGRLTVEVVDDVVDEVCEVVRDRAGESIADSRGEVSGMIIGKDRRCSLREVQVEAGATGPVDFVVRTGLLSLRICPIRAT